MQLNRRVFLGATAALSMPKLAWAEQTAHLQKTIPATGEKIPAIGMGTWLTFSIGNETAALKQREEVLRAFFERGGGMIDSSPMYGRSEAVVGKLLGRLDRPETLFSATKIWTPMQADGPKQFKQSRKLWQIPKDQPLDLVHVHNLLGIKHHLPMLKTAKDAGTVRHIGLTTSHGRRHSQMEQLIKTEPVDFVQFSYNILDRAAENRLLPAARDNGIAVIINRPFRTGLLLDKVARYKLPSWAGEIGCKNWAQFLLKFVISHEAVTCVIPATSNVDHMIENMGAGLGPMPDAKMRIRMINYVEGMV